MHCVFFPVGLVRNLSLYYNKSGSQYKGKKEIFRSVRANAGQIYHRTGSYNNKTNDLREINDEHGYLAGDTVRKDVAAELPTLVRKSDYFVRDGDENFLRLLSRISLCNAVQTADRIRWAVAPVPLRLASVDAGILEGKPGCDSVLRETEERQYQAKAMGNNTVVSGLLPCFASRKIVASGFPEKCALAQLA